MVEHPTLFPTLEYSSECTFSIWTTMPFSILVIVQP